MFPGANAQVYYNEAGEPLGWDYPSYDDEPYDPDDYMVQDEWYPGPKECIESGFHGRDWKTKGSIWDDATLEWVGGAKECAYCEELIED